MATATPARRTEVIPEAVLGFVGKELAGLPLADLVRVAGYLYGLRLWKAPPSDETFALPIPGLIDGLADAWGLSVGEVLAAGGGGYLTTNGLIAARRARNNGGR